MSEYHEFENGTWLRFEPEVFEFDVNKTTTPYNIEFSAKIDTTHYQGKTLPLVVDLYTDEGEHRMFRSEVMIRDAEGKLCGETDGSLVSIEKNLKTCHYFNTKGHQRLEVKQGTPKYEISGIAEIGIKIEKVKL